MRAQFFRLRDGSWGARVYGKEVAPDAELSIETKSGKSVVRAVGRVLWQGDEYALVALKPRPRPRYSGAEDRPVTLRPGRQAPPVGVASAKPYWARDW